MNDFVDRLPPHDIPAEQGVLSCCLGGYIKAIERADECIAECQSVFEEDEVFYDLRHQEIWQAMLYLKEKAGEFDVITLQAELKARGKLEQVGGAHYLFEIQEVAVAPSFLSQYLNLVWERYMARVKIANDTEINSRIMDSNGELTESGIAVINDRHERWKKLLERGAISPKNLCAPGDFEDAYYNGWFNRTREDYGWELPFKFPMRIRPSEMTLFTGDNGSGKSSMLGQISIVIGKQLEKGQKVVIASMEVPPEITLWIMSRQLLGVGKLEKTAENEKRIADALAWLNERILLYNFLGITDWRELLNTFTYAREHCGGAVFIVDSVMRIGIPDDDYALQGLVAAQFSDFAVKKGAHVFLVVHENKGEGRQKDRVRGSKQWTDNAANVCAIKRNELKGEKIEEWKQELAAGELTEKEFGDKMEGVRKTWDSKFILSKQRWPGSQQNASRWLYFDRASLQFHEYPNEANFNFIL